MQKIILALAGEMWSGKGAISEYLIERHGAVKFRFSDAMRIILASLKVEKTRENIADLSLTLRQIFWEEILSLWLVRLVEACENEIIVIDGVRRAEELGSLRNLEGFSFVYVDAPLEVRYARIVARKENDGEHLKTFEEFVRDHSHDSDSRVRALQDIADRIIENDGTREELYGKIEQILEESKRG